MLYNILRGVFSHVFYRLRKQVLFFISTCFACCVFSDAHAQFRIIHNEAEEYNAVLKLSFYNAAEGYVAFNDHISFTSDSGHTFTRRIDPNGLIIRGVKALSQDTLMVYGSYSAIASSRPIILYSTNKGNTYSRPYYPETYFNDYNSVIDLDFASGKKTGYAVTTTKVLKTTTSSLFQFEVN